jgi:hypothetical protein
LTSLITRQSRQARRMNVVVQLEFKADRREPLGALAAA